MKTFEWEIQRVKWDALRTDFGSNAADIPHALQDLAAAVTEEEAKKAYWRIDNHVVVQGAVLEAAEMVIPPLLQLLCESGGIVRRRVVELLIQVTSGNVRGSELQLGNDGLGERCRVRAREGLAIVYSLLDVPDSQLRDSAIELLDAIDLDTDRLLWTLDRVATEDPDQIVRDFATRLAADRRAGTT